MGKDMALTATGQSIKVRGSSTATSTSVGISVAG